MAKFFSPEIETASRTELEHLQSYRLLRTVRRMYDHVPTYRRRMDEAGVTPDDIKNIKDIAKLPFTYKQDLRDNYPYGMFAVAPEELVRIHASSGTTGKQTVVGYTKHDIDVWSESVARALVAIGAEKNDFIHVSYGYGLFTGGLGLHYGAELMGATVIPASSGNTARQIQIFQDFGSSILCCTPSYALYIADVMKQNGIDPLSLNLKAGFFGAEPWTEQMRAEIETRLGIKAYDIYGLSEIAGPGVAFDCECQNGMHVNEDHFYIEIIDPDTGEVLPDGELGEVVFTCISKEALPLIRYRTHDLATITHEPCVCGRTLVRMTKPAGRSDDMLIIRGVNVFPSQIESVLLAEGNAEPHYKIIVDRVNNHDIMEILVELPGEMFTDEVKGLEAQQKKMQARMESTLGISPKITFVEPRTIERSEGKAKRVEDRRKLH